MRIFYKGKDGGPKSTVDGYWLIEIKNLFSIVLLRFDNGTRTSYHTHAFNALTWYLSGDIVEEFETAPERRYRRRLMPKFTPRGLLHRVRSRGTSWIFSLRGPWTNTWQEWTPGAPHRITLAHGRQVVANR